MQTILNFIVKHNHWFLFLILEGISVMLIVRFNNYQSAALFTSTNKFAGDIFSMISNVDEYLALRTTNEELLAHNMELNSEITELRHEIEELKNREALLSDTIYREYAESGFIFNTANIVNNSLNSINNFIVIDKGKSDGITSEMGVFNSKGVVGIVYLVSEHYSLVLPLLNSKSSISCRVKGSNGFSTLQWEGSDVCYSYLVDLPRHTIFEKGDTVETSGFSSIFPRGIEVGTIANIENSTDGMFYRAKVKLSVDFAALNSVFLIGNDKMREQQRLESNIEAK